MKNLNEEYTRDCGYLFFLKGYLSQWYKIRMFDSYERQEYNCAEQYMMAEKARLFNDNEILGKILNSSDPREQKDLGRQVKNFDPLKWSENCKLIVYRGNFLKFTQNLYLKKCLIDTAPLTLVEVNPTDKVWAIGMGIENPDKVFPHKWQGTNFLGETLTRLRHDLHTLSQVI